MTTYRSDKPKDDLHRMAAEAIETQRCVSQRPSTRRPSLCTPRAPGDRDRPCECAIQKSGASAASFFHAEFASCAATRSQGVVWKHGAAKPGGARHCGGAPPMPRVGLLRSLRTPLSAVTSRARKEAATPDALWRAVTRSPSVAM
jgi:hypothetical protein